MATANNPNTFRGFLELLETATRRDQLYWESTPDDTEFRAPISGGHVWFARYPEVPPGVFSPDATPGRFTITLVGFDNKVLERFYALNPEDVIEAARFFGVVRRKVQNLDHSYDTMLNDLGQKANLPQ
ncbi:MAG TPA: hypothetical protein VKA46_39255 [Gemmataceae bacterium]|nr:hypothetical protein [Gemmataceae bacterium]